MRTRVSSRDKIIDVATHIIEHEGIDQCTARNISKEANIALGTIYNYFSNRDDLLEQVFIKSWQKTEVILRGVLEKDLSLEKRTYLILETLTLEVKKRNGLGEYLMFTRNLDIEDVKKKYNHFKSIIKVFITLLQESPNNQNDTSLELEATAMWIIFGHMNFVRRGYDLEIYYNLVINKLIK